MTRNKVRDVRVGLEIFERHGGTEVDAQHDVVCSGQAEGESLSSDEVSDLREAGWHVSSEHCRGCGEAGDVGSVLHGDVWHERTCSGWVIFT